MNSGAEASVDLYFSDLREDAQAHVLAAYSLKSPAEANWDAFPLVTLFAYAEGNEVDHGN